MQAIVRISKKREIFSKLLKIGDNMGIAQLHTSLCWIILFHGLTIPQIFCILAIQKNWEGRTVAYGITDMQQRGTGTIFALGNMPDGWWSGGDSVSLRLCEQPPDGYSSHQYEGNLLKKFREEHWELPPWNSQG